MVMVFAGESGEIRLPAAAWVALMGLARRYGWTSTGTVRPGKWSGSYVVPCGQLVTNADCAGLAAALRAASADVPDHPARPLHAARAPNAFELFSGRRRAELLAVADFFRAGACVLYGVCPSHAEREGALLL